MLHHRFGFAVLALLVTACVTVKPEDRATNGGGPSNVSGNDGTGDETPSAGSAASGSTAETGGISGSANGGSSAVMTGATLPTDVPTDESGGSPSSGGSPTGGSPASATPSGAPAGGSLAGSGGEGSGGASGLGGETASGGALSTGGGGAGGEASEMPTGLSWPLDCIPDDTCVNLDTPDTDDDGLAHDCSSASYQGHEGTDIGITWDQMDGGVSVRAAADGEVFFAADGKYDRCPNEAEPDCQRPADYLPGDDTGTNVCTELGPYCGTGTDSCFWCFAGGNVIVILHDGVPGVFATRYDHLKNGSVLVSAGDHVTRGQVIAEVGSAGNSSGPHLHFEVWGTGYYELADPWAGECGPNLDQSLWANEPPWE